jgi:stage II sporulation protein D
MMHTRRPCLLALSLNLAILGVSPSEGWSTTSPWFGGPAKAEVVDLQLPNHIKVHILRSRQPVAISCTGSYSYAALKNAKPVVAKAHSVLKVRGAKHGMTLGSKAVSATMLVSPVDPDANLTVNGRPYRGSLLIRPRGSYAIDVIEQVGLEDYLYGVLPREVGVDWPADSLKAQAVISRTYVVANLRKSAGKDFDVTSDVFSQVYGGLQDEHPASNAAVDATQGEILVDDKGAPILAFFHSSCGGKTESPEYVWQEIKEPPKYLTSVRDTYCKDDPFFSWSFEIGADTLQKRLRHAHFKVGSVRDVTVAKESPSGRAYVIEVESVQGKSKSSVKTRIPGNAFRLAVGADALRSTLLTTIKRRGNVYRFEGHGWGHGVGLCQWGALGRAKAGHSYTNILDAYYPHVRLVKGNVIQEQAKK